MDKILISSDLRQYLVQNPEITENPLQLTAIVDKIKSYEEAIVSKPMSPSMLYTTINRFIDEQISERPNDIQFSCKQGCNFCCHINVDISMQEAREIVKYCRHTNVKVDRNYLRKQSKIPPEQVFLSPRRSACVFLKEGLCSIYPVRPFACRKYFVVSAPERCDAKKYPPPNNRVTAYFDLEIALLLSAVGLRLGEIGPLPKMLLKALV